MEICWVRVLLMMDSGVFRPRDSVPYKFEKAIIQFEDRDFYSHMGFSFKAFTRAMKQNFIRR